MQTFAFSAEEHLFSLHEDLKDETWHHGGYETFRKGKGTHRSVLRLHCELERLSRVYRGEAWVLKCDIKKFFASIDHDILLSLIEKKIRDTQTRVLIRNIIESFALGLPLGNLSSQLFANIYMNGLDHFVVERLRIDRYMRYSDDFVLVHRDREYLIRCLQEIQTYLAENLILSLHPNKIHLRRFDYGIDWLGYVLYPHYRTVRASTRRRMWKRIDDMASNVLNNTFDPQHARSVYSSYRGLLCMSDMRDDLFRLDTLYNSM